MSEHRQHTFAIPQRPGPAQPPEARDEGALSLSIAALLVAVTFVGAALIAFAITGKPPEVTPIAPPQIVTTPLPPTDAPARLVQARLEDWRAGYEAAVQNGCKLQPLLTLPLEAHR